jgi:amphi-Trp domain-containing protein
VSDFELEERLSRERAAERLTDIAYALTVGGTLEVMTGGHRVSVPLADTVLLTRGGSTEGDRVDVEVRLTWSAPRHAAAEGRRASSCSPGDDR